MWSKDNRQVAKAMVYVNKLAQRKTMHGRIDSKSFQEDLAQEVVLKLLTTSKFLSHLEFDKQIKAYAYRTVETTYKDMLKKLGVYRKRVQADGELNVYELRLMSKNAFNRAELPTEGRFFLVVANAGDYIKFRFFDDNKFTDYEKHNSKIVTFKEKLEKIRWNDKNLSRNLKEEIIKEAISNSGHTHLNEQSIQIFYETYSTYATPMSDKGMSAEKQVLLEELYVMLKAVVDEKLAEIDDPAKAEFLSIVIWQGGLGIKREDLAEYVNFKNANLHQEIKRFLAKIHKEIKRRDSNLWVELNCNEVDMVLQGEFDGERNRI